MNFDKAYKLSGTIALPASSQLVPAPDLNAPFHHFLTRVASIYFFARAGVLPAELGKLTKLAYMNLAVTKVSGRFVGRCDWSIVHNYQSAPPY